MVPRYKCLILDHDDTVVDSTSAVHYPAYLKVMQHLRPDIVPLTPEGWLLKNFHPGISQYFEVELGMTAQEQEQEYRIWRSYATSRTASFFPGMTDFLIEYKRTGGKISVVSHSERDVIEESYRVETGGRVKPDLVFGWEQAEHRRKPNPWPVMETLKETGLKKREVVVVDDLKPAVIMARASGVSIAAAGWSHNIPEIRKYMERECDAYLASIDDLREFILPSS